MTGIIRQMMGQFNGIKAEVVNHQVWGAPANALVLYLPESRNVLSGLQGFKKVSAVCNCYMPESLWQVIEDSSYDWRSYPREVVKKALSRHGYPLSQVATLVTGVDMRSLAWDEECYDSLWVQAWVTAGFKNNAMRVGMDKAGGIEKNGQFNEVGTINIIVLTNACMSQAAMAASFITVTEAKVIALQEADVRSSYNSNWQATGTGTDQIIVVSGKGDKCNFVGGHTMLGELMARAVTKATGKAIENQINNNAHYNSEKKR